MRVWRNWQMRRISVLSPQWRITVPFLVPAIFKTEYAPVMELVDMRDLGSRAHALGFESPCPHQKCPPLRAVPFWCALLRCKSGRLRADNRTRKGNPTKVSLAYLEQRTPWRTRWMTG